MLSVKVGTYNIRFNTHRDHQSGDDWKYRLPVISSILHWESPDVFGVQEPDQNQFKDLQRALPQYAHYGVGRSDGKTKGEFTPIFYNKERFSLIDSGTFWLSETPEHPSKGWDAKIPRICSWVQLQDQDTQQLFWFFNTHFDHAGTKARLASSYLLINKIRSLAQNAPTFLVGDFNVDQKSEAYQILQGTSQFTDAFEKASHHMAWNGTINAFNGQSWTVSRIDHIFTTPSISVDKYAILTESYRSIKKRKENYKKGDYPEEFLVRDTQVRLPSDHFPVFIKVKF